MPRLSPQPNADRPGPDPGRPELRRIKKLLAARPPALAAYHAVGEQLRRLAEDPGVSALAGWRQRAAQAAGISESTLNKCLQFRREYEGGELAALESLEPRWGRLSTALAVKDKRKRHALLRRARREGWDDRALQLEAQRLRAGPRGGGRPRKEYRSHGLVADLGELARLSEVWADFHGRVWDAQQAAYAAELQKLPPPAREELGRALAAARKRLGELRRRCGRALDSLGALRVE
jgi:hypothetical protein